MTSYGFSGGGRAVAKPCTSRQRLTAASAAAHSHHTGVTYLARQRPPGSATETGAGPRHAATPPAGAAAITAVRHGKADRAAGWLRGAMLALAVLAAANPHHFQRPADAWPASGLSVLRSSQARRTGRRGPMAESAGSPAREKGCAALRTSPVHGVRVRVTGRLLVSELGGESPGACEFAGLLAGQAVRASV